MVHSSSEHNRASKHFVRRLLSHRLTMRVVVILMGSLGWVLLAIAIGWWYQLPAFQGPLPASENVAIIKERQKKQVVVTPTTVTIPLETVVILRGDEGVGAFILTDSFKEDQKRGVRYRAYFAPGNPVDFKQPDVVTDEAVVFEHYDRYRTKDPSIFQVTDLGSECCIRCGPLNVPWSFGGSNSHHLYFVDDMEIGITWTDDISSIQLDDPSYVWCNQGPSGSMQLEEN